jgi:hypothetical protein
MRRRWLILLAASAWLLLACDASSLASQFLPQKELEEAQATVQAVAPTVAAVATAGLPTKAPSSATQAAPAKPTTSPSGSSNPFANAIAKAKGATKYRVQFSWIFGGMDKGKYSEQPFMDFNGEIDGAKAHLTSKGGLLAMLSSDPNTAIELVEADSKTFMKGVSMFGMADPKLWYITDEKSSGGFADMAKPDEYNSWMSGSNAGDVKKTGTESLDGQSCDVYLSDVKSNQNAALLGLLGSAQDKTDFSAVDKGEMRFWLCPDGYVHKFLLDYQGHDAKDAAQKASLKMMWHAWDFNNPAIAVTVPKDAKPLPGN